MHIWPGTRRRPGPEDFRGLSSRAGEGPLLVRVALFCIFLTLLEVPYRTLLGGSLRAAHEKGSSHLPFSENRRGRHSLGVAYSVRPNLRSDSKCAAEGLHESTRLGVANAKSDLLDGEAGDKQLDGPGQSNLPPPRIEIDADVVSKNSLNGSHADAGIGTKGPKRARAGRLIENPLCNGKGSRIARQRHLGGRSGCAHQLQNGQIAQRSIFAQTRTQSADPHDLYDQFSQERGNVQYRTSRIRPCYQSGTKVKGPHRNSGTHANFMKCAGRDPKRELRRNQPQALARVHFHHAGGCIDQLVRAVGVVGNQAACRVLISQGGHGNAALGIKMPKNPCVTHSRHIMAR